MCHYLTQELPMPTTNAHQISSNTLAWFAEGAHGQQEQNMYIVEDANGDLILTDKDPRPAGKEPFLEVFTKGERPKLMPAQKIAVQLKNGKEKNLLNDPDYPHCDALFWSASSIEKFLFPYYHAHRLYSQAEICGLMTEYRANKKLVAALHVAPSRPGSINQLDTAGFLIAEGAEGVDLNFVSFKEFLARRS
jgi:hypothetical protein